MTASSNGNGNGYISRGNFMAAVTVTGLFLAGISGVAGFVISGQNARMYEIEKNFDKYLTIVVHEEFSRGLIRRFETVEDEVSTLRQNRVMVSVADRESKRIDDRFTEFKKRTDDLFSERRDDIGTLRKEVGGFTPLRDTLTDIKKEQGDLQRQILEIVRSLGARVEPKVP